MKNKIKIFLVFIIIFLGYSLFFYSLPISSPNSPDESQIIFFSENFKDTGSPCWESHLNNDFNTEFFRPRGSVSIEKNNYCSLVAPQLIIIYSTLSLFISYKLIILFISLLGILFFYLFLKEFLIDKQEALIGTIIFSLLPTYFFYTSTLTDSIPSFMFFLASLFFIAKFRNTCRFPFFIFSVIAFSFSAIIRIHNLLLIITLLPFLINKEYMNKILFNKKNLISLIGLGIFILLLLSINFFSYGNILTTGRILTGQTPEEQTFLNKITIYGVNIDNIFISINNYIITYSPLLLISGFLGFIYSLRKKEKILNYLASSALLFSLFLIIYLGSNNTFYNFNISSVQGSLSRYFLPIYTFFIIYLMMFLRKIKNRKIKIFFLMLLLTSSILFTLANDNSFSQLMYNKNSSLETNIWAETTNNSVFLVKQHDKFVIPHGEIMLIYEEKDTVGKPYLQDFYPLINVNQFSYLVEQLKSSGYNVYITTEENSFLKDLELKKMNDFFYEIK